LLFLIWVAEYTVFLAKLQKKIDPNWAEGVQAGLNELAKTPEFVKALHEEVAARHLVLRNVTQCISRTYEDASKNLQGSNESTITLGEKDHTPNQRAVLVSFLRVQSGWLGGLQWKEEKNGKAH